MRLSSRERLKAQAQRRLQRQLLTRRLHRLGARVVFEFLDEIARHHDDLADDMDRRLAAYASLNCEVLRATGGDRFPPSPTRVIGGTA